MPTTIRPSTPSPFATQQPYQPSVASPLRPQKPIRPSTLAPFAGYPSGGPAQPPYNPSPSSQSGYKPPSRPAGPSGAPISPYQPSRPSQSPFNPQSSAENGPQATTPSVFTGSVFPSGGTQSSLENGPASGPVGNEFEIRPSGPAGIGTSQPDSQLTSKPAFPSSQGPVSPAVSPGAPDSPDENSITEHPDEILQGSHSPDKKPYPVYVIPFPVNIVPSPSSCPCYLVTPGNGTSGASQNQPPPPPPAHYYGQAQQGQPYGIIGYIPVVFYPYCPGNESNHEAIQTMFPSAVSAPYACNQCVQPTQPPPQRQEQYFGKRLNYQSRGQARAQSYQQDNPQNTFQQVMSQANIDMSSIARAPHKRKVVYGRRIRSRKIHREENS